MLLEFRGAEISQGQAKYLFDKALNDPLASVPISANSGVRLLEEYSKGVLSLQDSFVFDEIIYKVDFTKEELLTFLEEKWKQ